MRDLKYIRNLIGEDLLGEAFKETEKIIDSISISEYTNWFFTLKSWYNSLNRDITNSYEQTFLSKKNLIKSLLELLSHIEKRIYNGNDNKNKTTIEIKIEHIGNKLIKYRYKIITGVISIIFVFFIGNFLFRNENSKVEANNNDNSYVVIGDKNELTVYQYNSEENNTCRIPLTEQEQQKFKSTVFAYSSRIRSNPFSVDNKLVEELTKLVASVDSNYCYKSQMKLETAMLYRIYGSAIILGTRDVSIDPKEPLKVAFPYIKESKELDNSIWASDIEQESYKTLNNYYNEIDKIDFTQTDQIIDYVNASISSGMLMADNSEVRKFQRQFTEGLTSMLSSKKMEDLKFFLEHPLGNSDYKIFIESLKLSTISLNGEFEGPDISSNSKNQTIIRFFMKKNKNVTLEWIVDKNSNLILANNQETELLENAIRN